MKDDTRLVTAGRDPSAHYGAVNVPVYRASTILHETVAEMDSANAARSRGEQVTVYGRSGTPTVFSFANAIAQLEGGYRTYCFPSGMAAIAAAITACVKAGDHILVADCVYGPTRLFCDGALRRFGVETTYFDPVAGIDALLRPNTTAVFVEAPGSHTFEMQDIPAIVGAAHRAGARVLMDNTWATPLYFKALAHGVDISIHSATKYIVGHADAMLGTATCTREAWDLLNGSAYQFGQCASPDDIYLAQRGLRTLGARLKQHEASALVIADWLRGRPEIAQVLYPALPGAPGHDIWKRDFLGASGLFAVELKPCADAAMNAMLDRLELFGLGASWGGFESLALPGRVKHIRTASPWNFKGPLVRFHIGLEAVDDLIADLKEGFMALNAAK